MKILQIINEKSEKVAINLGMILSYSVTKATKRSKAHQLVFNVDAHTEPVLKIKGTEGQCEDLFKAILGYMSSNHQERYTVYVDEKGYWLSSKKSF